MRFSKMILLSFLFVVPFAAKAQSLEETFDSVATQIVQLDRTVKQVGTSFDIFNSPNAEALATQTISYLEEAASNYKKRTHLSMQIYLAMFKDGTDRESEALVRRSRYKDVDLESVETVIAHADGAEIVALTKVFLKQAETRKFLMVTLSEDTFAKIAKAFVHFAFANVSARENLGIIDLMKGLNATADQVKGTHEAIFHRVVEVIATNLLEEAKSTKAEGRMITQLMYNFDSNSVKVKKPLIQSLSRSQDPMAYSYLRQRIDSKDSEVSAAVLGSLRFVRDIESTNDMIRIVREVEQNRREFNHELRNVIKNKVFADLDRASNENRAPTPLEQLVVQKMRSLVFNMLASHHSALRINSYSFLRSPAFTDSEVEHYLLSLANEPNLQNRWNAPDIVRSRKMITPRTLAVMQMLVNDPDPVIAADASFQILRIENSLAKALVNRCSVVIGN